MIQVDMHVHSRHSRHPSEWFLQRIGAQESYTEVEEVYRLAKARGMRYVTLTDHNTIDGAMELNSRHPEDTFISSEITCYFPEDGCKIHVLVYGITPAQFDIIQSLREDIRKLRDYLVSESIPCSVAHATFSINNRLSVDTMEKLVLLFDVFEGINGGRNSTHNNTGMDIIRALTPEKIESLSRKHGIKPSDDHPWIKGMTGGSDDHAGLMIGRTYTNGSGSSIPDFLENLRQRKTLPGGRSADHKSLSCAVYQIAYRYSQDKCGKNGTSPFKLLNNLLFDNGRLSVRDWLAVQKLKRQKNSCNRAIVQCIEELVEERADGQEEGEAKVERIYKSITRLSDGFFALIAESLEKDLQKGETDRILKNMSASLPVLFLLTPLLTVLRHMHGDRDLLRDLNKAFGVNSSSSHKLLWFSDTVTELNGVAVTMRELAECANSSGRNMRLVTCLAGQEDHSAVPANTMMLPCIYNVTPGFYNAWTLRMPSLLAALDMIAAESPDEIVISTPGPVGLVGLAAARLLRIKCTGIYHTDFTRQADQFIGDHWVSSVVEAYTRGFFTLMDEVRVPTARYIEMLADRGLERSKMKMFPRSIEPAFAVQDEARQKQWRVKLGIPENAPVLLWAGRLGLEKNLDFLFQIYHKVSAKNPGTFLVMAGDGPELQRLKSEHEKDPWIVFTGRIDRCELPHLYGMADVFVFPSITDTFGMVILEAQSCGLPAVVSDIGGPQELVTTGETGFVVKADDLAAWVSTVNGMLDLKANDPDVLARMKQSAREKAHVGYGWGSLIDDMMGLAETDIITENNCTTGKTSKKTPVPV